MNDMESNPLRCMRALNLETTEQTCELSNFKPSSVGNNGHLYLVYLPIPAITQLQRPAGSQDSYQLVRDWLKQFDAKFSPIDNPADRPEQDGAYWGVVPTSDREISASIAEYLADGQDKFQVIFAAAGFYAIANDRISGSVIHSPGWLFWDDGNLWEGWADLSFPNAWCGSGWASLRTRNIYADPREDNIAKRNELMARISQGARDLVAHLHSMENLPRNARNEQAGIRRLAETLARYLPRYRHLPKGQTGGIPWREVSWADLKKPSAWRGISDDRLDKLRRSMVLDGWLTLWPDRDNQLLLQPGSLALMYWAAATLGLPHTKTPEAFVSNYEWQNDFFGGRVTFGENFD